ncbi:Reticulon-like protein B17 [Platanthera guangdongensis]|uniref:Reticulon-like protein n=1 Tax=Platanthera guangdongensis TaxID=2320717 RepID=A0ABR2N1K8_9ASPA
MDTNSTTQPTGASTNLHQKQLPAAKARIGSQPQSSPRETATEGPGGDWRGRNGKMRRSSVSRRMKLERRGSGSPADLVAARKEMLSLIPLLPSSSPLTKPEIIVADGKSSLDGISEAISDLLMWKNMAKSTLWFAVGSSLILSSIFSGEFGFSIVSAVSHLAIMILFLAFFYDSFTHRIKRQREGQGIKLTEEEVFRVARVILPIVNAVLAKGQEIFSGEPLMTLKVSPVLLFMAMFGHLITLWRLAAIGFFLSFTVPKLYSCYYQQIEQIVEDSRNYVLDSWRLCSRKKLVATVAAALLWNMSGVKMRACAGIFYNFLKVHCC